MFSTVGEYLECRGGCSVPWEDIIVNVGRYLEHRGGVQYRGRYLEYLGGFFSTVGDV